MASIRGTFKALNYLYLVGIEKSTKLIWLLLYQLQEEPFISINNGLICLFFKFIGIFGLNAVIPPTYFLSKYSFTLNSSTPNSLTVLLFVCWYIVVMIFINFSFGEKALEENRPSKLRNFAALVLSCLFLQIGLQIYVHMQASTLLAEFFRPAYFGMYDTLSMEQKELIQMNQQEFHCCGMLEGWKDYGKPPEKVPDSCCGRYAPNHPYAYGNCTEAELEKTPGCEDQLFKIIQKTLPNWLLIFLMICSTLLADIFFAIQLLLATFAVIQAFCLLKQNNSRNGQNLEEDSASEQSLI